MQVVPHKEEGRPGEKLNHTKLDHGLGSGLKKLPEALLGFCGRGLAFSGAVLCELFGRIFLNLENGYQNRQEQDCRTGIVRPGDVLRSMTGNLCVGSTKNMGHNQGQQRSDY